MTEHFVSIICPVYNEERYIGQCLDSVVAQDYPKDSLELIVVDGMSTDGTRAIVGGYAQRYSFIRLIDNEHQVVPYALNYGIDAARGDVIMRLDGHCLYPPSYVSRLVDSLFSLGADNVGGVWNTLPARPTPVCEAIAVASSHPFGVGSSMHKIGTQTVIETDTVPFGCYRREVFDRIGRFDTDLVRNQDDEFNGRLSRSGGRILLIPDVVIDYHARDTLPKMRRMYYQYGLFKPLVNRKLGAPATARQFFPLLFVVGIIVGGVLSCCLGGWVARAYLAVLSLYLFIGLVVGAMSAVRHNRPVLTLLMPYVFANVHLSYGFGYLVGLLNLAVGRNPSVKSNR